MIEITQAQADQIMRNIDKHISGGYGTAFDGTYIEGGGDCEIGSYKRLQNMLAPMGVKIVMDSEYTEQKKYDIFHLMSTHGGSFAKALSYAWFRADPDNRAKIEEAFAELVSNYAKRLSSLNQQVKQV